MPPMFYISSSATDGVYGHVEAWNASESKMSPKKFHGNLHVFSSFGTALICMVVVHVKLG